jgi:hypothetical protein
MYLAHQAEYTIRATSGMYLPCIPPSDIMVSSFSSSARFNENNEKYFKMPKR